MNDILKSQALVATMALGLRLSIGSKGLMMDFLSKLKTVRTMQRVLRALHLAFGARDFNGFSSTWPRQ